MTNQIKVGGRHVNISTRSTVHTSDIVPVGDSTAPVDLAVATILENMTTQNLGTGIPVSLGKSYDGTGLIFRTISGINGTTVTADDSNIYISEAGSISLNSPAFTGLPTAPTVDAGDNSDSLATTAFVTTAIDNAINQSPPASVSIITSGVSYTCTGLEKYIIVKKTDHSQTGILLPSQPYLGQAVNIKDGDGSASLYNITILSVSGTIDGSVSNRTIIDQPYQAVTLIHNGTDWNVF